MSQTAKDIINAIGDGIGLAANPASLAAMALANSTFHTGFSGFVSNPQVPLAATALTENQIQSEIAQLQNEIDSLNGAGFLTVIPAYLFDVANWFAGIGGDVVGWLKQTFLVSLPADVSAVAAWFASIGGDVLGWLTNAFTVALPADVAAVAAWFSSVGGDVLGWLTKTFAVTLPADVLSAAAWFASIGGDVLGWLKTNASAFVEEQLPADVLAVAAWFSNIGGDVLGWLKRSSGSFVSDVSTTITTALPAELAAFEQWLRNTGIGSGFGSWLSSGLTDVVNGWNSVQSTIKTLIGYIISAFQAVNIAGLANTEISMLKALQKAV
jgi:hypothetical protein